MKEEVFQKINRLNFCTHSKFQKFLDDQSGKIFSNSVSSKSVRILLGTKSNKLLSKGERE